MNPKLLRDLRILAELDPLALHVVHGYVRYFRFLNWLGFLPLPARLAIVNFFVLTTTLIFLPRPHELSPLGLIFIWMASFCMSLSITTFLPRRRRAYVPWAD